MPSLITALLGLAASATAVLGHGHVREVVANGLTYPGYHVWATDQDPSRVVTWSFTTEDEGPVPVARLGHPDIVCHANAQSAQASVPVAAGDEVLVRRFNSIGGFEHPGPEMHYLASCGGAPCADVADKTALEFYKFYERGLVRPGLPPGEPDHGPQLWATNEVHRGVERVDGGYVDTFAVRIPADTPTGHYVLRHEILGLHRAFLQDAEFYPQCINLNVTGSGSGPLPQGTRATELYNADDPGIDIDIWLNLQSYQIPGPPVATSAASAEPATNKRNSHPRDFRLKN